jgi:nitrogen regulatory protein PII
MDNPRLKLLFLIIDWDRAKIVSDVFEKEHCRFVFMTKAMGTANSEILDLLGIGSTDKAVILCLENGTTTPQLIKAVRRKMGSRSTGAGIAFTIPLSGISASIMQVFLEASDTIENEKEEPKMANANPQNGLTNTDSPAGDIQIKNDLIITILNHGYSDDFMTTARKAGARGGTVISARGLSAQKVKKFLGISVQEEKEIIIILANKDQKVPIMQAVSGTFGTSSKAGGTIFSLPVDQVMSLNEI